MRKHGILAKKKMRQSQYGQEQSREPVSVALFSTADVHGFVNRICESTEQICWVFEFEPHKLLAKLFENN